MSDQPKEGACIKCGNMLSFNERGTSRERICNDCDFSDREAEMAARGEIWDWEKMVERAVNPEHSLYRIGRGDGDYAYLSIESLLKLGIK